MIPVISDKIAKKNSKFKILHSRSVKSLAFYSTKVSFGVCHCAQQPKEIVSILLQLWPLSKELIKKLNYFLRFIFFESRYRERRRESSSIHQFTLPIAAMVRSWLVQSQEPGSPSRSCTKVQGPKDVDPPLLPSQVIIRKQDWKWNLQDTNKCSNRMLMPKVEAEPATSQCL